ncbi:MAG: cyclase family protein [Acidimicrobiia bacterium]
MTSRPKYADLPDGSAWDVLDADLGSLALLTPERVAAAARLVRSGKRFPLDLPLTLPSPPFFGREPYRHEVFSLGITNVFDDKLDNFYPQSSTQWDGFGHFGHAELGFFGGRSADDVEARTLGIEAWAMTGIAGRGVLLDVGRHADIACDTAFVVTPEILAATADAHGVEIKEGDVLCVRLGWLAWYKELDAAGREAIAAGSREYSFENFQTPGLAPGPAIAAFLWDHGIAAIAVDNPGVEPFGPGGAGASGDSVHTRVLALLGIPLGEFFDLDALADDCAADGVYEFLFTSKPLGIQGGLGSPPNAMAIK